MSHGLEGISPSALTLASPAPHIFVMPSGCSSRKLAWRAATFGDDVSAETCCISDAVAFMPGVGFTATTTVVVAADAELAASASKATAASQIGDFFMMLYPL